MRLSQQRQEEGWPGVSGSRGCDTGQHVKRGVCSQPGQDVHCLTGPVDQGQSQQDNFISHSFWSSAVVGNNKSGNTVFLGHNFPPDLVSNPASMA